MERDSHRTAARFCTTDWKVVCAARQFNSQGKAALETLYTTYWNPVYAFIRQWGKGPKDAEDLTQEFFIHHLLDENYLAKVEVEGGKFRNLIRKSVKHFLLDEHDREHAKKRSPDQPVLSFDAVDLEHRHLIEPIDGVTPEDLFDLQCAQQVLEEALTQLRNDYRASGKVNLFDELEPCLTSSEDHLGYAERGARLGMTENAVKQAAHRLKKEWKEFLRAAVAATITSDEQIEAERRELMAIVGRYSRSIQPRARREPAH